MASGHCTRSVSAAEKQPYSGNVRSRSSYSPDVDRQRLLLQVCRCFHESRGLFLQAQFVVCTTSMVRSTHEAFACISGFRSRGLRVDARSRAENV